MTYLLIFKIQQNLKLLSAAKYMWRFIGLHHIIIDEPWHEVSNNVVCATSNGSDQPAHTCSLIRAFANRLNIL